MHDGMSVLGNDCRGQRTVGGHVIHSMVDAMNERYMTQPNPLEGNPKTLGKAFYMRELGELLAILHRDGGQYLQEHGWEKAVEDAKRIAADSVVT